MDQLKIYMDNEMDDKEAEYEKKERRGSGIGRRAPAFCAIKYMLSTQQLVKIV